jgi:hypothetical protein
VLTHWKEREPAFRARRRRIEADLGYVPAYAAATADVEPKRPGARRTGRLTAPDPDTVSAAEFEQMKRDLDIERQPAGRTSPTRSLSKRLSHTPDAGPATPSPPPPPIRANGDDGAPPSGPDGGDVPFQHAPDIAESETAPVSKPKPAKSRTRNRRHGRRR